MQKNYINQWAMIEECHTLGETNSPAIITGVITPNQPAAAALKQC